jgi:hypothetical protein
MPRYQFRAMPKGSRVPGSGRVKGTPNHITVEARQLADQLVNDRAYQARLKIDFRKRKVHPTIEAMLWAYTLGRPRQQLDVDIRGTMDATVQLADERQAFAALDFAELEELAADSQRLVDRAMELSARRAQVPTPQDVVRADDLPKVSPKTLELLAGSDNSSYVNSEVDGTDRPVTDSLSSDLSDTDAAKKEPDGNT